MEGKLHASAQPGCYTIGDAHGPELTRGQEIEIFLGGNWIAGRIDYSSGSADPANARTINMPQNIGTYYLANDDINDTVQEASEESFPASDSPAWSTARTQTIQSLCTNQVLNGYYFKATADGSVCGLCIGMKARTR